MTRKSGGEVDKLIWTRSKSPSAPLRAVRYHQQSHYHVRIAASVGAVLFRAFVEFSIVIYKATDWGKSTVPGFVKIHPVDRVQTLFNRQAHDQTQVFLPAFIHSAALAYNFGANQHRTAQISPLHILAHF